MRRRGPVFVALPIDVLELETSVEAIVPGKLYAPRWRLHVGRNQPNGC